MLSRWMYFIRSLIYMIGIRPSSKSFFHSDSLDAKHKGRDNDIRLESHRRKNLKKQAKDRRKNNWGGKF